MPLTKPDSISKDPGEILDRFVDFAAELGVGGTIASVEAFTATDTADNSDATAAVIEAGSPAIVGQKVKFRIKAGQANRKRYKLQCRIVAGDGQKYEANFFVEVLD